MLSLAGGEPEESSDGKNVWDHLSDNRKSSRNELLLNIDDMVYQNSGLRVGKWKIVFQERKLKLLFKCYSYGMFTSQQNSFSSGKIFLSLMAS